MRSSLVCFLVLGSEIFHKAVEISSPQYIHTKSYLNWNTEEKAVLYDDLCDNKILVGFIYLFIFFGISNIFSAYERLCFRNMSLY